jgi:uncharacterized protein YjbI with pentapeptide repeats
MLDRKQLEGPTGTLPHEEALQRKSTRTIIDPLEVSREEAQRETLTKQHRREEEERRASAFEESLNRFWTRLLKGFKKALMRVINVADWRLSLVLFGLGLLTAVISVVLNQFPDDAWPVGLLQNLSSEMCGAGLTFIFLEILVSIRQNKERLIRQLGSELPQVKAAALQEMIGDDWFGLGWLRGVNLSETDLQGVKWCEWELTKASLKRANLQQADLSKACLEYADLEGANLKDANLEGAKLKGANLSETDLQGVKWCEWELTKVSLKRANLQRADLSKARLEYADLEGANLKDANLEGANLVEADLQGANLKGADLWKAHLEGANLTDAKYDQKLRLPNLQKWQPQTEMRRFTGLPRSSF